MPEANDAQMQRFFDERIRPRAEQVRALLAALKDDKAAIDDIYTRAAGSWDWGDARTDGPPHLATRNDALAYNSFVTALIPHIEEAADWPAVLDLCVRPVS